MGSSHRLGRWGEAQALRYLSSKGMCLVGRNFRTPFGEIDLIMEESGALIFIEVKTRSSLRYGTPEESITASKMQRLYEASASYLDQYGLHDIAWRIDVVAIQCTPTRQLIRIDHYANLGLEST